MQALKINDGSTQSGRRNFEQGMNVLVTQLHTMDQKLSSSITKEIQKQVQYQRQDIMYVQNTLLSHLSTLSLD